MAEIPATRTSIGHVVSRLMQDFVPEGHLAYFIPKSGLPVSSGSVWPARAERVLANPGRAQTV